MIHDCSIIRPEQHKAAAVRSLSTRAGGRHDRRRNRTAGNWIVSVASQMTVPQTVTFVNDAAITTQDFSTFALIHVPSTVVDLADGGISLSENGLFAARALDISNFINDGHQTMVGIQHF